MAPESEASWGTVMWGQQPLFQAQQSPAGSGDSRGRGGQESGGWAGLGVCMGVHATLVLFLPGCCLGTSQTETTNT